MERNEVGPPQGQPPTHRWAAVALVALMLLGLGIRLYDLTDPPLDFHETRQLGSAVAARGMYYQMLPGAPADDRSAAEALWDAVPVYEPRFLERLVALTYLISGGENIWVARIYSATVWVLGALGVYGLGRAVSSPLGGVAAAGYYLLLPYAVIASRSFQPDPLMTVLIVLAYLALFRWRSSPSGQAAITAGVVAGLAILVKAVAVFPVLGGLAGTAIGLGKLKDLVRNRQLWAIGALALLPSAVYYFAVAGQGSSGLFSFWVLSLRDLLGEAFFYVRWVQQMEYVVGFGWLAAGLLGTLLLRPTSARWMMIGVWTGYLAYGLALPFQIMTHDYYHLMLVPMVAIGLAGLISAALSRFAEERLGWRLAALGVAGFVAASFSWEARVTLAADDYRLEAAGWRRLGEAMPRDGEIIALTHAYGTRLQYYAWLNTRFWPGEADIGLASLAGGGEFDFESEFESRTDGARYFLITNFAEWDRQPELKEHLRQGYEVYREGDGYILFDLEAEAGSGS